MCNFLLTGQSSEWRWGWLKVEVTWGQVGFEVGGMGEVRWPSIGYVWLKQKQWKNFLAKKR